VLWLNTQYLRKEFLNQLPPRSKFNPYPPCTRMQCSVGSHTYPTNAGTYNPCGLTRPVQDSISYNIPTVLGSNHVDRCQVGQ